MRKLNTKKACVLVFMVYDKVHIVTVIASDVSGVTILIDIVIQTFLDLYTRL